MRTYLHHHNLLQLHIHLSSGKNSHSVLKRHKGRTGFTELVVKSFVMTSRILPTHNFCCQLMVDDLEGALSHILMDMTRRGRRRCTDRNIVSVQQLFDIIEPESVVRMQHLHASCTNLKLHIFTNVSASVWISCLLIVFSFTPHQC